MEYKRHIVTSWSITFFWVFLSFGLSILTIYSFLQADWIIKRNLIITNYYQFNSNSSNVVVNRPHQLHYSNATIAVNLYSTQSQLSTINSTFTSGNRSETERDDSLVLASDIETELLANDEYFLYSEENYTIPASESDLFSSKNHKLVKITKILTTIRFGTLGICTSNPRFSRSDSVVFHCELYGENHVYSVSSLWPMVTVIGGSGCVTLCVSAVLSTLAVALPSSQLRYQVAATIGHAQTVAVALLFLSLLIFPLGFDSDFVHYHCGSSASMYSIGECEIGWAYALVLVCSSLALYCPILVKFTSNVRYEELPKYI